MSYTIEQFYRFFQGVLVFQTIYLAILYGITRRKDMLVYSIYLLLQAIYFFWNAPFTFFNIDDGVVFGSSIYHYGNMPLITIINLVYIYFLRSFFSSLYKNKAVDRLVLFITITSPVLIAMSSLSIYFFNSNQYIFYTINLLSTFFSIYLLIDIRRRKIKNIQWVAAGMVFNIIGNVTTVVMIILGQYGVHNLFTIGYPLLFMRFGILLDMVFYQIAILKKWSTQEKELAIQQMKTQIAVEKVKSQISSELHDDIGSTLSGINMYSHMAQEQNTAGNQQEAAKALSIIQEATGEVIGQLKDMVWSIQPGSDNLLAILDRIKEYAIFMAGSKSILVKTDFQQISADLKPATEQRHHIFMIAKEAINNAVKYSGGSLIEIGAVYSNEIFTLTIMDNGNGFDVSAATGGNGLRNMQKRAEEMGGVLQLNSSRGTGTEWILNLKITH